MALGANQSFAQDTLKSSITLEEVIVTAQKREQSLKDVPVSIEVLSGDFIESLAVANGFDLLQYLPGFGVDDNTEIRTQTLKTRGIGTFTNSIGLQSSNLIAIDGEILPRQSMLNIGVDDTERVEALRGPQGTLFGQNTSTGLIHYVTKKPSLEGVSGRVKAQFTQDSGREVSGVLNLPINDKWATRFNAKYSEIDGWIRNTQPGEEDNDIGADENFGLRAQALYDSGEKLDAVFRIDYSERETNCCSFTRIGNINPNFGPPAILIGDDGVGRPSRFNLIDPEPNFDTFGAPATSRNAEANFGEIDNLGISTEVNYAISDNLNLSYNGSYRDFELRNSSSFFTVNFPVERSAFGGTEGVEVIQQEVRLTSSGNERLNWVVGLFYHDTDGERTETRDGCIAGRGGIIEGGALVGCVSPQSRNAFFNSGGTDRSILDPDRLLIRGNFTTEFENTAVFGQLDYNITDRLQATLGGRFLRESSGATFDRLNLGIPDTGTGLESFDEVLALSANDPSLVTGGTPLTEASNSDTDFTYKAVLGYDFTDNVRGYTSYSTGYKGASYFVTTNTNPDEAANFPVDPEQSTNFEIGLRTKLFNNRLLFNATYFDLSVEDYQIRGFILADAESGQVRAEFVNADEVRSTGVELDFIYQLSESIKLTGSYANFDANFEDFADAPANCPLVGGVVGGTLVDRCSTLGGRNRQVIDLTGLPIPNNSEEQFVGTVQYATDLFGWDSRFTALWRYNDEATRNTNEIAFNGSSNPSNGIWDLTMGFSKDNIRVNVFVKNLLDKEYSTRQNLNAFGFGSAFFPRDFERYVGGSVQYQF